MNLGNNIPYEIIPEWSDYYLVYYHIKDEVNMLRDLIKLPDNSSCSIDRTPDDELSCPERDYSKVEYDTTLKRFMHLYGDKTSRIVQYFTKLLDELENDVTYLDSSKGEFNDRLNAKNTEELSYKFKNVPKRVLITFEIFEILTNIESFLIVNSISLLQVKDNYLQLNPIDKSNSVLNKFFLSEEEKLKDVKVRTQEIKDKLIENFSKFYSLSYKKSLSFLSNFKTKKIIPRRIIKLVSFNIVMIALYLIFYYVPVSYIFSMNEYVSVYFASFNFTFCVIFVTLGISIALHTVSKFRLNYLFMFKQDPRTTSKPASMITNSLSLFIIWWVPLIANKIVMNFIGVDLQDAYYVFSLTQFILFLVLLLLPFNTFYFEYRKQLLTECLKIFYPIGKDGVSFKTFIFSDILTSFTRPLATIIFWFCLIYCKECRDSTINVNCPKSNFITLGFQIFPFIIRFAQCINKYYYTKKKYPHLANALKYLVGVASVTMNNLYSMKILYELPYILINVASTLFSGWWDLRNDFGLLRLDSKNFLLRNSLTYPKAFYYWAMISNTCLRFTWTLWRIPFVGTSFGSLVLSCIELFRRSQWLIIRLEVEELQNPEAYREYLIIPKLPLNF